MSTAFDVLNYIDGVIERHTRETLELVEHYPESRDQLMAELEKRLAPIRHSREVLARAAATVHEHETPMPHTVSP